MLSKILLCLSFLFTAILPGCSKEKPLPNNTFTKPIQEQKPEIVIKKIEVDERKVNNIENRMFHNENNYYNEELDMLNDWNDFPDTLTNIQMINPKKSFTYYSTDKTIPNIKLISMYSQWEDFLNENIDITQLKQQDVPEFNEKKLFLNEGFYEYEEEEEDTVKNYDVESIDETLLEDNSIIVINSKNFGIENNVFLDNFYLQDKTLNIVIIKGKPLNEVDLLDELHNKYDNVFSDIKNQFLMIVIDNMYLKEIDTIKTVYLE